MQALGAALWTGESEQPGILREIATAAWAVPPGPAPPKRRTCCSTRSRSGTQADWGA